MLLSEKMKKASDLSDTQKKIVDFMLEYPERLKSMSLQDIAAKTYTTPAALVRLAKKFGYTGFVSFCDAYIEEMEYLYSQTSTVDANYPFSSKDSIQTICHNIAALEKEAIEDTMSLLDFDGLKKAIKILDACETIHFCGISFNHLLGESFANKMMRIGKKVIVNPLESDMLYSSALVSEKDAAIIVSYTSSMPVIKNMLKLYKSKKIPVIALTSFGPSDLRQNADVTLTISTREKMYSKIAGFSNETSIKLLLDILYSGYFSNRYEKNKEQKNKLSSMIESWKRTSNEIIDE